MADLIVAVLIGAFLFVFLVLSVLDEFGDVISVIKQSLHF